LEVTGSATATLHIFAPFGERRERRDDALISLNVERQRQGMFYHARLTERPTDIISVDDTMFIQARISLFLCFSLFSFSANCDM